MEERITRLERAVAKLTRAFREHRHTGLDSQQIDLAASIKRQGTLTGADGSTIDSSYSAEEADVIANNRTRIQEIEDALIAFGILE